MAHVLEISPQKDLAPLRKANELQEAGRIDEAYALIDSYLMDEPNDAQAIVLGAAILKKARKVPLAYQLAQRAVLLRPEKCETWGTLGHCAQLLWRQEEALSAYRKALDRARDNDQKALYESNIASVLLDTGRFSEAEPRLKKSLTLKPKDPDAEHNLALALLAQRRWAEGWPLYSSSMGSDNRIINKYKNPAEPVWDGTPGKSVVISGEQGLGDEICAASMLPDAIRDCKKVIVDCDKRLENLFRRSFPQASVYGTRTAKPGEGKWKETSADIDASIAGFEVAKFYRTQDADFPGIPYLQACPVRSAAWRAYFDPPYGLNVKAKPTIGIAWTGGIRLNAGLHRRLPLTEWGPIFDAVDANWVSLQYKDASEDIKGTPVVQYPWATLTKDYDDTAALVSACDLIIGVQTSVVHLAGALGKRCLSLIPSTSQWRYGEKYEDLPWYNSVRLIRVNAKDNLTKAVPKVVEWLAQNLNQ